MTQYTGKQIRQLKTQIKLRKLSKTGNDRTALIGG